MTGPAGRCHAFAYHNWWHLALFHLDRGDACRALTILDERIVPGAADVSMALLDVTTLLWRLVLLDVQVDDPFEAVAAAWRAKQAEEAGYYAFNDFHAALAFAGAGDLDDLARVRTAMERAAREGDPSNRVMSAAVGLPLIDALTDYAAGRFARASKTLAEVRDIASRFGGSHAQRDLLTLLLIDAARRAGQPNLARHYLNERLAAKPASGLGWRMMERI